MGLQTEADGRPFCRTTVRCDQYPEENNLYRVDMLPGVVRHTPLKNEAEAIDSWRDAQGNFWIASHEGVLHCALNGTLLAKIDVDLNDPHGLGNNTIALFQDDPDILGGHHPGLWFYQLIK